MRAPLLAAVLLAVVAAPTAAAGTVEVRLVASDEPGRPFEFEPERVAVPPGTVIRWVNAEDVFHSVTSSDSLEVRKPNGDFDQTLPAKGAAFERRFDAVGEHPYYCKPHVSFMFGAIIVEEGAPPQGRVDGGPAPDGDDGAPVPGLGLLGALAAIGAAAPAFRRRR